MFITKFGPFDGNSWEGLCQLIFKKKYHLEGYQTIPASPGDFGLEGFTIRTGWCFQCYCPDKHYDRNELYEKQRNKITTDLNKLSLYQTELQNILGDTKLSRWIFVTPEFDKNELIKHARRKERDVKDLKLPFLTSDFCILLHDGDDYLIEINEIRSASGEVLIFDDTPTSLPILTQTDEIFEENIYRKSTARLTHAKKRQNHSALVNQLYQNTLRDFLESDGFLKRISEEAPTTYFHLLRLINEYEKSVAEMAMTWTDTPEKLTAKIRDELAGFIKQVPSLKLDEINALKISRYMVARWLAICELDYYD